MSYSYTAVGCSGSDYVTLAEDSDERIYFAGEVGRFVAQQLSYRNVDQVPNSLILIEIRFCLYFPTEYFY